MTRPEASDPQGQTAAPARAPSSPLAPFAHPVFTVLWLAAVVSNMGTWMHDVGAGWLMTTMAPSPLMVALVQTATTLPIFLFAIPAGALGDIVDRRRLLIAAMAVLGVVAGTLGVAVLWGLVTPGLLLAFTFVMGTGAAVTAPAWQAIVPSLVPKADLQPAVALNSVGINVSRAIGPALAGFIITAAGVAMPFLINATSYLLVVAALLWWRQADSGPKRLPPEHLFGAIRTGLRYARNSAALRATLGRAVAFFLFASAYWALLPLIARDVLGGDARFYGIVLGCVGAGAVAGALFLPRLRARLGADRLVMAGTFGTALVLVVFATVQHQAVAALASLVAGASWIAVLTSLNVSAQVALPDWVRARGLSIFVTVFFGSMSAGSLVWGQTASMIGIAPTLLIAAAGAVAASLLTRHWRLQQGGALDLSPSMHWPAPLATAEVAPDRGPVLVTVEYRVDPEQTGRFVAAMGELARARRRDGAYSWGVFEDVAEPGLHVEHFMVASWLEHLRQHDRVTVADRVIQDRIRTLLAGGGEPVVRHLLAPEPAEGDFA